MADSVPVTTLSGAPALRAECLRLLREEPIRTKLPFTAQTLILESTVGPNAHTAVSQPSPPRPRSRT